MKKHIKFATVCVLFAAIVACGPSLFTPVTLADDHGGQGDPNEKSTWVTSIAQVGTSAEFVAATADGLLLREAAVVSFQAADPTELKPLYTHPAAVWCVDSTADGSKVASVDYRGNLVLYDVAQAKPSLHEKALERWCQAMQFAPDDKSIVAGNEAGKILIWDIATGKVTKTAELDGHAVTGIAISPDGSQLAASDGAGHVHLLKWPGLEAVGEIKTVDQPAWCVAFSNDGSKLFVGSADRNLYQCDAKADAKAESVAKGADWITELAVSTSGQIAAGEVGGRLHFPSLGGTDSMDATSGVWALCWNGDSQLFAGTRKDGILIAGQSWKWTEPAPPQEETVQAEKGDGDAADEVDDDAEGDDSAGTPEANEKPEPNEKSEASEKGDAKE